MSNEKLKNDDLIPKRLKSPNRIFSYFFIAILAIGAIMFISGKVMDFFTDKKQNEISSNVVKLQELEAENDRLKAESDRLKKELAEKEVQENSAVVADKSIVEDSTPIEEQKRYYNTTIKPELDLIIDEYDLVWDSLWVKTFNGISDGSMNFYDGYEKLKTAEKRYDRLYDRLNKIPTEGLDKERTKQIGSFSVEIQDAVGLRIEAIKKAIKMFDKESISPSTISELEELVDAADDYMHQAVIYLAPIDKQLSDAQ